VKDNLEHHAAISYGMISRKTVDVLFGYHSNNPYDKLGTLFSKKYNVTERTIYMGGFCQIEFSLLFTEANIPIKDYREYYSVPFWILSNKEKDVFVDYSVESNTNTNTALIAPTQMVTSTNIQYDNSYKKEFI
jgi:hypothetical protein